MIDTIQAFRPLAGRVLAIPRARLASAIDAAAMRAALGVRPPENGRVPFPRPKLTDAGNGVRAIFVRGMVSHGLSEWERFFLGAFEVDALAGAVRDAVADPAVSAVLVSFNSPGGMVQGVPEAADAIARAAEAKPVFAYTSTVCASAAYWLAAGCTAIYAAGSADLGSIGCYAIHEDRSAERERDGIKIDVFKSGENKAAGIVGTALSEEQKAILQRDVDTIGESFRAWVSSRRPGCDPALMDGRAFDGRTALAAGFADEISTPEEAAADAARMALLETP